MFQSTKALCSFIGFPLSEALAWNGVGERRGGIDWAFHRLWNYICIAKRPPGLFDSQKIMLCTSLQLCSLSRQDTSSESSCSFTCSFICISGKEQPAAWINHTSLPQSPRKSPQLNFLRMNKRSQWGRFYFF